MVACGRVVHAAGRTLSTPSRDHLLVVGGVQDVLEINLLLLARRLGLANALEGYFLDRLRRHRVLRSLRLGKPEPSPIPALLGHLQFVEIDGARSQLGIT